MKRFPAVAGSVGTLPRSPRRMRIKPCHAPKHGRFFWIALLLFLPSWLQAAPPSGETLRVAAHLGALRDASRADVEVSLKVWAEELTRFIEVPTEIRFYDAMPAIQKDFAADRVNFVIADGIDLLRHFAPEDLADGFGGRSPGEDTLYLLVRKDAGIESGKDLAGKRIALLSQNEISDLWLETFCLRTFQKPCDKAGLTLQRESRSRQQVLQVFFGRADAALVRGYPYELAVELNPQIRARTQVLERIRLYPGALGLFGQRVSPAFREYVISRVPLLHEHPRGRQLLEVLQSEKIGRFPKSVLGPIRALAREHEGLSRRYLVAGARK